MAIWASGLNVSRWAKELSHQVGKEIYFSKFMGDSYNNMVVTKSLEDGKGKDITFGLVGLTGTVVLGDATLEENESNLTSNSQTVTSTQRRFGVINTGNFDDSKVLYNFRSEALTELSRVYAEDIDSQIFSALTQTSGSGFGQLRADDSASAYASSDGSSNLAAADLITTSDISKLKKYALLGASATEKMRPIKVDGKDYYVLLIHPEVAYDLSQNSTWTAAQREAGMRGMDNPIFSGALGVWDGVVVHEHEGITTSNTMGSGAIKGARNLFMGASAAYMGEVGDMSWVEKTFDYGNQLGIAAGKIYGVSRAAFNSKDMGCIQYLTARTDL
jgi:N4-gp56 family major capsid protein